MAQWARTPNLEAIPGMPVAPGIPLERELPEPALATMTRRVVKTYFDVKHGVRRTWLLIKRQSSRKSDEMLSAVDRARLDARYRRPLRTVAVMAGGAFLAGALLRVWRSRYER